jgi:hypothetical protein
MEIQCEHRHSPPCKGAQNQQGALNTRAEHSLPRLIAGENIHISIQKLVSPHTFSLFTPMLSYCRDHSYFRTSEVIILDPACLKFHVSGMDK